MFQVERREDTSSTTWSLRQHALRRPIQREYDTGIPDELFALYAEAAPPETLHFLAAGDGGRPSGLLTWRRLDWNDTIWLIDIRVRGESRRGGVGSALIVRLQDIARSLPVRGISLETQSTNFGAVQFYRRHGFALSGVNDHLYSNDDLATGEVALFLFWSV